MKMSRLFSLFALLSMLFTTGCTNFDLSFGDHAAYQTPVKYPAPLIIVMPSDFWTVEEIVATPRMTDLRKFHVFYGQALRAELAARFNNMFSDLTIVDEESYETHTGEELNLSPSISVTPGKKAKADPKKVKEKEEFKDPLLSDKLSREEGYIMLVDDLRFGMADSSPLYRVRVRLIDSFTDEQLMEGYLGGTAPGVAMDESTDSITAKMRKNMSIATSALSNQLRKNVEEAIEAGASGGS